MWSSAASSSLELIDDVNFSEFESSRATSTTPAATATQSRRQSAVAFPDENPFQYTATGDSGAIGGPLDHHTPTLATTRVSNTPPPAQTWRQSPAARSHRSSRRSSQHSLSTLGHLEELDDIDFATGHVTSTAVFKQSVNSGADDDDDGLPDIIYDAGEWASDGRVFARIPPVPPDADLRFFVDDTVVDAAIEFDQDHVALPRRDFEDIERASRMLREREAAATRKTADGGDRERDSRTGDVPSARSRFQAATRIVRDAARFGGGLAPAPPASKHAQDDGWRSPSPATSEDSLDAWRKTVVVPPRTPTPPSQPGQVSLPSLVLSGAGRVTPPSVAGAVTLSRLPTLQPSQVPHQPRTPDEVLASHRLFADIPPAAVDGLRRRRLLSLTRLPAGTSLSRSGEFSAATHLLVLVDGSIDVFRGEAATGAQIASIRSQGSTLLEAECRGAPRSHKSAATLVVSPGGATAWALVRDAYHRLLSGAAGSSASRAASRLLTSSSSAMGTAVSLPPIHQSQRW